jgi:hypothetical protein
MRSWEIAAIFEVLARRLRVAEILATFSPILILPSLHGAFGNSLVIEFRSPFDSAPDLNP